MAGHPVTVTVGTVWKLSVTPPPPRPPRLTVGSTIFCIVLTLMRIIFGVAYFKECPQQPNIPNYLLGLALIHLLMTSFVTLPCERDAPPPRDHPRGFKDCMQGILGLFILVWILMGDVWVFLVYQPNYDATAADGLYCNKTLYTFAFWNAVYETVVFGVLLANLCKGVLCYVTLTPAPMNRDFYV
ncbi:transmembrane protein 272-like [Xenentodon cancila]